MEEDIEIELEQSRYDSTASAISQAGTWRNWSKSPLPKITTEANFSPLLDGSESSSFVLLRISALNYIDEELVRTVERIRNRYHTISLQKALDFVRELGSQTEQLNVAAPLIPSMIIAAGMNTGDHGSFYNLLHSRLLAEKQEKKTVIVRLVSYECFNIRNAIGTIFSQLLGIFPLPDYEQKKTKVSDFGLIVEWYKAYCEAKGKSHKRKRNQQNSLPTPPKPPFVILFEDFDYFSGEVVEKLIFFCQRRRIEEDIPFLFFFSVACFGDSVKKKVEYQAFCNLRIETNQLPSAPTIMDAIISEVFIKGMSFSEIEQKEEEKGKEIVVREGGEGCYFRLSSIAFSNAVDGFVQFHASVGSFVESCRESILYHFFTNPLSFYCALPPDSPHLPPLTKEHLAHIRSLPSFLYIIKKKEDRNGVQYTDEEITKLMKNDAYLKSKVSKWMTDIQVYLSRYWVAFQCVQAFDELIVQGKKISQKNAPFRSLLQIFSDEYEFAYFYKVTLGPLLGEKLRSHSLLLAKWKEILEGKKGFEAFYRRVCDLEEELVKANNYETKSDEPSTLPKQSGKGRSRGEKMLKAAQKEESEIAPPAAKRAKKGGKGGGGGVGGTVKNVEERCGYLVMDFIRDNLHPLDYLPLHEAVLSGVNERSQNPHMIPEIVTRIRDPPFYLNTMHDDYANSDTLEFQKVVFEMMVKKQRGTFHLSDWMSQFVEHVKKEARKEKKALEGPPQKKKGRKKGEPETDTPEKQLKHQKRQLLIEKFFETKGGLELLEHCFLWSIRTLNFLGFSHISGKRPDHVELMGYKSVWRTGNVVLDKKYGR